ncbi:DUF6221 family protein [Streptomyces bauhiniae]|uniref:DUF6221 family protein n=1 Tax=Streptomyces bauhiniae TaxID=2340725 RepID=UPI003662A85F
MDDLVRWLRAQLDEDERIAQAASWCDDAAAWRAAPSKYGTQTRPKEPRWYIEDSLEDGVITTVDPRASDDEGVAVHIAEHDPARVLREVEAGRRLIRAHAKWCEGRCEAKYPEGGCDAAHYWNLKVRAEVYADRPGYHEEWRP